MNLVKLELEGVYGINSEVSHDSRGNFFRVFEAPLLESGFVIDQVSVANNPVEKTLRGLHYQESPHAEAKLIQCITGEIFDVLVDIQKDSPSFGHHLSLLLGPKQMYQGVFVPKGYAHGYMTLEPNSTLLYFMDQPYKPESAHGIIWSDPALNIDWPFDPVTISERDRSFKGLSQS
jgi:dTDP-4-dehydrorhamnose 3,5-epimerase